MPPPVHMLHSRSVLGGKRQPERSLTTPATRTLTMGVHKFAQEIIHVRFVNSHINLVSNEKVADF